MGIFALPKIKDCSIVNSPNFNKSKRRQLRESALQALYAYEMTGEGLEDLITSTLLEVRAENDREFFRSLIQRTVINKNDNDAIVQEVVNNWELERLAIIDLIIIRMGITELKFFPDIPPKVSINECLELAKEFSTQSSARFINGILDRVLAKLKELNNLNKTGRGLLHNSIPHTPLMQNDSTESSS